MSPQRSREIFAFVDRRHPEHCPQRRPPIAKLRRVRRWSRRGMPTEHRSKSLPTNPTLECCHRVLLLARSKGRSTVTITDARLVRESPLRGRHQIPHNSFNNPGIAMPQRLPRARLSSTSAEVCAQQILWNSLATINDGALHHIVAGSA